MRSPALVEGAHGRPAVGYLPPSSRDRPLPSSEVIRVAAAVLRAAVPTGECLLGPAGHRSADGRSRRPHALVFELTHRLLIADEFVWRTCGSRLCVLPAHLKSGNFADQGRWQSNGRPR